MLICWVVAPKPPNLKKTECPSMHKTLMPTHPKPKHIEAEARTTLGTRSDLSTQTFQSGNPLSGARDARPRILLEPKSARL